MCSKCSNNCSALMLSNQNGCFPSCCSQSLWKKTVPFDSAENYCAVSPHCEPSASTANVQSSAGNASIHMRTFFIPKKNKTNPKQLQSYFLFLYFFSFTLRFLEVNQQTHAKKKKMASAETGLFHSPDDSVKVIHPSSQCVCVCVF